MWQAAEAWREGELFTVTLFLLSCQTQVWYSRSHGILSLSGSSERKPFQHPLQATDTTNIGEVGDEKTPPPFGVEKEMVDFHQRVHEEATEFPLVQIRITTSI